MFLRQRLGGLEEGWEELGRMWENRQQVIEYILKWAWD